MLLIRPKLFLTFFVFFLVPLGLLVGINYWRGRRATEWALLRNLESVLANFAQDLRDDLHEHENDLVILSRSETLQDYLAAQDVMAATRDPSVEMRPGLTSQLSNRSHFVSVALFDQNKRPVLFAVRRSARQESDGPVFQLGDFLPGGSTPDEKVWTATTSAPILSSISTTSSGAHLHITVPIFPRAVSPKDRAPGPTGALVGEVGLDSIFSQAAKRWGERTASEAISFRSPVRTIVAINYSGDNSGRILYHPNPALKYQSVANSLPELKLVKQSMLAGERGWQSFTTTSGEEIAAAYRPLPGLNISIAALENYSESLAGLRRTAWIGIIYSLLFATVAALLLARYWERRSRGIERVREGAAAIAGGKLDHRIELLSSDENRALADSFNLMSEQLREQIAHETEARQFQSFVKLSAMLTHDLKNAIGALSLIVGNMERHFDNQEFRADAMKSLNIATQNLGTLVDRLTNPVRTLSGEYKRPRPVDLVPMLKRSLEIAAGSKAAQHEMEVLLPPSVMALVDGEGIEKVIENLVFNALEAMSQKAGKLTVAAGNAGPGETFFSITDTGSGMSREFIERQLYRPFATTKKKGVGLGLYTCREVVRANLGSIEVDSTEGAGTTFRVVLPSATIEPTD